MLVAESSCKQKKAMVAKDNCCLKRSTLLATATTAK